MDRFLYTGERSKEISFPLGGIGTGCVGLAGNGQLVDVEIFGAPNKGSHASFTHFAVKAEDENGLVDARALVSDYMGPRTGGYNRPHFNSYGFGADRATLMGLPHFRNSTFRGEFPVATLAFEEEKFPGSVTMTAFNPFIPTNEDDSGIPAAFFSFSIKNTGDRAMTYSIAFSAKNFYADKGGVHSYHENCGVKSLHLGGCRHPEGDVRYGDMCISTDADTVSRQCYWYRGSWFDNLATFWSDFTAPGSLKDRVYDGVKGDGDPNYAADDLAVLMASLRLEPGETGELRFVWSWNTPNARNYWNPESSCCGDGCDCYEGQWKNYYATQYGDSLASGRYAMEQFSRLYKETMLFHDALFSSTLPDEVIDAISSNLAIIKSPTCLRLEDGSLYGFEGCHCDSGCCEGSCTHVWSYTYAIPFLFPALERSMRTLEYRHSLHPDGGMGFRIQLPAGRDASTFRPCVDGQYGTVMRVLREYKISGDIEWLQDIWPQVKKTIEFAWHPGNSDRWDPEQSGIMTGRQHHTLDMELFGESAWLSGMYLGGLKAGAELARILGEEDTAARYNAIFHKGRERLNQELFNGEYFIQKVDLNDKSQLDAYRDGSGAMNVNDIYKAYWNEERSELTYQIGDGCGVDQVLAQWHADMIGLGDIFDPEKTRSALASIYKYNFIPNMREHFNPCRIYCMGDEGGVVICAWPEGARKPLIPAPYAEETMHGFEYQAACHMIARGMTEEGLTCVRALRNRYDGAKRNPWNEFECGSNYARSMASYALLLAYSGFRYDLAEGLISFAPVGGNKDFRCFWSVDGAWGVVAYSDEAVTISVLHGTLPAERIGTGLGQVPGRVTVDGADVPFSFEGELVLLERRTKVSDEIVVSYR